MYQFDHLTMGACYYPEHWDRSLWTSDLKRMLEAGITVIRIAEFSWVLLEPAEGNFDFSLFDDFLALCRAKGMKVILGTPTATPPAWLTKKYPETLNSSPEGIPYQHGGRRHYNYNADAYLEKCRIIAAQMAKHFGQHPAVIGWQLDNEINCETDEFYSEADAAAFRVFLKEKYKTMDVLNEAWGTVFWSQCYGSWDEVGLPMRVLNHGHNPHQMLDYYRFISDSAIRFAKNQADVIRPYLKDGDFITTNGLFDNLDNLKFTCEVLDLMMYDSYPNFGFGLDRKEVFEKRGDDWEKGDLDDRKWSLNLTKTRSVCPHFGIMEQQSGAGSWTTRMAGPAPKPGQLRLWALQSLAHGADFVSFFRWRTAVFGTEIYWHGILDYDNRDNRRLAEVMQFYKDMMCLDREGFAGADFVPAFGVLTDVDNEMDRRVDDWHARVADESEKEIFAAAQLAHRPYDLVDLRDDTPAEDLLKYPVLFYPHPVIMTGSRAQILRNYVAEGGTLIIGARSGYKDIHGKCIMQSMPGLLNELTGTTVKEFTFISPADRVPEMVMEDDVYDAAYPVPVFADVLEPGPDTKVLARFAGEDCCFAGEPTLTVHAFGKGRCLHLGSTFHRKTVQMLFAFLGLHMPCDAWIDAPAQVELVLRERAGRQYLFVLNYLKTEAELYLKVPMRNVLTGTVDENITLLPPYGAAVYTPL